MDLKPAAMTVLKLCTQCGEAKAINEFYVRSDCRDGRMKRCKTCHLSLTKAWRQKNKDKHRIMIHAWHVQNRGRALATRRKREAEIREAAGPAYAAKVLRIRVAEMPESIALMKQQQLVLRRLAKLLTKEPEIEEPPNAY